LVSRREEKKEEEQERRGNIYFGFNPSHFLVLPFSPVKDDLPPPLKPTNTLQQGFQIQQQMQQQQQQQQQLQQRQRQQQPPLQLRGLRNQLIQVFRNGFGHFAPAPAPAPAPLVVPMAQPVFRVVQPPVVRIPHRRRRR
jgi:hypothetical protein